MRNFVFFLSTQVSPCQFRKRFIKMASYEKKWSSVHLYHNISNNFRSCHGCTQDQECSFCWDKDATGNCFPAHYIEHSEPEKQHRCNNNETMCLPIDHSSTPYTWVIVPALVLFVISYSVGKLKLCCTHLNRRHLLKLYIHLYYTYYSGWMPCFISFVWTSLSCKKRGASSKSKNGCLMRVIQTSNITQQKLTIFWSETLV